MSLQQTLNNMVGLPYLVNTHEHIIIRVKVDGDTVHIITDKDWFKFDIEEAPDKIKGFLPMDKEVETSDIMTLPKLSDNKDLTSIVMEQIQMVRKDPAHIPVAKAVSGCIQTLLNMTKLQLQIEKYKINK